jgi:hypothetical protein
LVTHKLQRNVTVEAYIPRSWIVLYIYERKYNDQIFFKKYTKFKIECPPQKNPSKQKAKKKLLLNAFHIMFNRCSPAVFAKNIEPLASRASRFTIFTSPGQNLLAQIILVLKNLISYSISVLYIQVC